MFIPIFPPPPQKTPNLSAKSSSSLGIYLPPSLGQTGAFPTQHTPLSPLPHSPSIPSILSEQLWSPRFDHHILAQGKKMARPAILTDFSMEKLEDGGFLLTATVADETPFEAEVSLWPESEDQWDFDTTCTCSYGSHCSHTAALLLAAAKPSRFRPLVLSTPANRKSDSSESASPAPALEATFELHLTIEPASSKITRLLLQALRTPRQESWLVARPTVHYGDHSLPLSKSHHPTPEGLPDSSRNKAAEFRALEALAELGLTHIAAQPSFRFLLGMALKDAEDGPPQEASAWFPEPYHTTPDQFWPWFRATAVPKLKAAGWTVHVDEDFGHPLYVLDNEDMDAQLVEAPSGWFHLSVGFEVEGENLDLLPILIDLLEDDTIAQLNELPETARHLIYLPNGGALHLPVDRLRKILQHLSALVDPSHPALHPLDAARMVVDSGLPLDTPPRLEKLRQRLEGSSSQRSRTAEEVPDTLQATLRPYQAVGFQWMCYLAKNELHGILADDMGLGKTMQTLALLLHLKSDSPLAKGKPSLVVAPTSVVPNWLAEAKKFAPSLKVLVLTGPKRKRLYSTLEHADLILTSFAILQRDVETLKKQPFQHLILDEAQHIKNPTAQVSLAACELQADHRLCLSGTPIENNLGEMWSLFRFLIPGFLGPLEVFRTRFQHPIEKEDDEEARHTLRTRLTPLIMRRTKDEVAKDLPPKTILVHPIELSTVQKDLYETVRATMDKRVRDAIAARGISQSKITILDALLKLRQICCDPRLLNYEKLAIERTAFRLAQSAKLTYFLDLLDTLLQEKRRILLFSQFTTMLSLIEEQLERLKVPYLKLTGASKDRGKLVEDFQSSDIPVFLISLKAGGTGLNLTGADTVIHYDPWWNPAAENQATDRAYRIGQDKPVFVHKLLCATTVEDRIHQLQQKKSLLADSLLSGASQGIPDDSTLQSLLAPLSPSP
jgi:superfamily II DNA or RNA helicase